MEAEVCQLAPGSWSRRQVQDVCLRVTSGGTPNRRKPEFFSDGTWCWVKSQELQDTWIDDTEEKITDEALVSSGAKVLPPNTVMLALYGATVGQLGLLRRAMTCNQACCAMIVDPEKADFRYLFYQLVCARPYLKRLATGAAQQNLSGQLIKSLTVPFPPLKEQEAIACILGALDDKIELNRRMNETLEAMARAIFKSWFVDFDPVRAKAAGRKPAGMDAATVALFPAAFQDSPIGPIPKGWVFSKLGETAGVNERSITKGYPHDRIEYVDISSVSEGKLNGTTSYSLGDAPGRAKRLVTCGDTIWSCVRPNRKSYLFIHEPADNLVVSTGFAVLTPRSVSPSYLYCWVTTQEFVDYLSYSADGSAYPAVRPDRFVDADMLLPAKTVLNRFEAIIAPMRATVARNEEQSRTLAATRDALLPRLLSGEIRVGQCRAALGKEAR